MKSFRLALTGEWQEVLQGGSYLAFDCVADPRPSIFFGLIGDTPADSGSVPVATFPQGWDFEGHGFEPGIQRIWLKGVGDIVGVRA